MNFLQTIVNRAAIVQSTATNATSSISFDTWVDGEKADRARLQFCLPVAQATNSSAKFTSLIVGHATTTDISNATTLGTRGTGTTNTTASTSQFVLPPHNDTSNKANLLLDVDLTGTQRYLHCTWQAATNYNTCVFGCTLSRIGKTAVGGTTSGASHASGAGAPAGV